VVIDDAGEPVPNASVMVEPPAARAADERRRAPLVGITDDLGRYRVGELAEGSFVVVSVFAAARTSSSWSRS